jgi:ferric-dicitrate binding protein FerR (iron transport regulator)
MYMKGNRELDDLLTSYILEDLSGEDEAFVLEYIRSDESNRRHFEELRKTWRAITIKKGLEKVNEEEEWKLFEQRINRERQQLVAIKTDKPDKEIEADRIDGFEQGSDRKGIRKVLVAIAIAASVLAVVVFGRMLFAGKEKRSETVSVPAVAKTDEIKSELKKIFNTSGKPQRLLLSDGSEIVLADKSEISYAEPFATDKRVIFLKGKADFTVVQDKMRPFTVYSFDLATTVLGTVFTVSAFEHAENIVIQLKSGKVVVKPVKKGSVGLKQDYYLLPGQELIYNNRNYTATLLDGNKRKSRSGTNSRNEEAYTDIPNIPENNKGSWYMFNNESLEQVFDQLKLLFNTDIVYSKEDVYNLYFAGRFDKSDSLYTILSQIASVNNLKVSKKDNKYIVAK